MISSRFVLCVCEEEMAGIKPDTPVVVALSDGEICLHANVLDLVPTLSSAIRAIAPVKDPRDGAMRGTFPALTPPVTLKEFAAVLSRAHGGAADPRLYRLLSRFKLVSDKDYEDYVALLIGVPKPEPSLLSKEGCSSGAMSALCLSDPRIDGLLQAQADEPKLARAAMDIPEGEPSERYTVSVLSISPDAAAALQTQRCFMLMRNGDTAHTFVLKVLLRPRDDGKPWNVDVLDQLFRQVTLNVGGQDVDTLSLLANNAMAKARGLWPTMGNTPPKDPKSTWLVTIPIMFAESEYHKHSFLPLIALYHHEVRIRIEGLKAMATEMLLDADYVYLDRELRRHMANNWEHAPQVARQRQMQPPDAGDWHSCHTIWAAKEDEKKKEPSEAACSVAAVAAAKDMTMSVKRADEIVTVQHFDEAGVLEENGATTIRLRFSKPTSGILIMLNTEEELPDGFGSIVCPVVSARLQINNHDYVRADMVDLTEWNWLKVGLRAPNNNRTLLLPFSREMFNGEHCSPASTVDFSRVDIASLVLVPNEKISWMRWKVTLTSFAYSVRRIRDGVMGLVVSP